MIIIDKLAYSSKIRFESPYLKSFFAIASLMICVSASSYIVSIVIMLLMGGCAVYYSRVSFSYYIRLMLLPAVFLILSTVTIILNVSKDPLDLFAISVGHYYITGSTDSLIMGLILSAKAFGCVSCLYFLILTTPIMDLFEVLRRMHVPTVIIELMMLMYRFIFILMDMGNAILISQACRLGHKDMKTSVKSMGNMLAVLLVRAYKKSDYIYNSMEARCYDGTLKVVTKLKKAKKSQTIMVLILETALIGLTVVCAKYGV